MDTQQISASPLPIPTSPIPSKVEVRQRLMTFPQAMDEVRIGKKVHKLEWEDKNYYGFLHEARLRLHKPDGKLYDWAVSEGDMLGKDYIVV